MSYTEKNVLTRPTQHKSTSQDHYTIEKARCHTLRHSKAVKLLKSLLLQSHPYPSTWPQINAFHDHLQPTTFAKFPQYRAICSQWVKHAHHWCVPWPHVTHPWHLHQSPSSMTRHTSHRKPYRGLPDSLWHQSTLSLTPKPSHTLSTASCKMSYISSTDSESNSYDTSTATSRHLALRRLINYYERHRHKQIKSFNNLSLPLPNDEHDTDTDNRSLASNPSTDY